MWRQVRETGREGPQEEDRRLLKKRATVEGQIWREKWRGRKGEERETHGRETEGRVRKTRRGGEKQTPGRDRDGREMGGHLRYRELGPPNSSGFQGNGDGRAPGVIPRPWNGSAHSSRLPVPLQCPTDTLNLTSGK